jgi:cytochrome c553
MKLDFLAVMMFGVGVAWGSSSWGAEEATDAQKALLRKTIDTCATCHGVNGKSIAPTFPNLAAQSAPYIETQLRAFRDQSRADPDAQAYMWGMASQLSDSTIAALAAYYAAQPAQEGKPGNTALIAKGKQLFEEGIPAQQVPACASCHGKNAEGRAVFPRLASQHGPYLFKQLLVIQNVLRTAPVMHGVVKDLTKEQMQAVVAYLESI